MLAEWSGSVYYGGNGSCSGSKTWRSSSSGLGGLICVKKIKIVLAAFSRVFTNPVTYVTGFGKIDLNAASKVF